jgi:hypothetical protein
VLTECSGRRERRWDLAELRLLRLAGLPRSPRRAAALWFAHGRCVIVSHSWRGPGQFEDRMDSFSPLVRSIAGTAADLAPRARFATAGLEIGEAFVWTIGLLGIGAVVLVVLSIGVGAASLGIALASRLLFVLILLLAALPWLKRRDAGLDPRAIPRALLP